MSCRIPHINWSQGNTDTPRLPSISPIPSVPTLGQHSADLGCCLLVTQVFIPRGYESLIVLAAIRVHLQLALDMQVLRYARRAHPSPTPSTPTPQTHTPSSAPPLLVFFNGPAITHRCSQHQLFIYIQMPAINVKGKAALCFTVLMVPSRTGWYCGLGLCYRSTCGGKARWS